MRLEVERDKYFLYVNQDYCKNMDFNSKESIASYAKTLVLRLKRIYGIVLQGFYQMKVFVNDCVGMFIELVKLDDFEFELMTIDLKVIIFLHQTFLLQCTDFDFFEHFSSVYFRAPYYYGVLQKDEFVLPCLEYGKLIYGPAVDEVLQKGILLKQNNIGHKSHL